MKAKITMISWSGEHRIFVLTNVSISVDMKPQCNFDKAEQFEINIFYLKDTSSNDKNTTKCQKGGKNMGVAREGRALQESKNKYLELGNNIKFKEDTYLSPWFPAENSGTFAHRAKNFGYALRPYIQLEAMQAYKDKL